MKKILTATLLVFFSILNAQLKKVEIVDFYHWNADDGIHYELMLITENLKKIDQKVPAVIRVKYSLNGGVSTKLVEYKATALIEIDSKNFEELIFYIDAEKTAKILQGENGYTPDNFVLHYNINGDYIMGYQADHSAMAESEVSYAKVFKTNYNNSDELRSLIKLYYTSSDPLYRDLMTYAAQFD